MKKTIGLVLLVTLLGSNAAQANESNYGFCFLIAENQEVFFSEISQISSKVTSATDTITFKQTRAAKNFESYIRANYDNQTIVSSWCDFKYSSYQQAQNSHTDKKFQMKNQNYHIRLTSWSYSGN